MWLLLLACSSREPDVVLVVVDTLRADVLGSYGYEAWETSPELDAFAEQATLFERAYAPAPWTLPSIATILTGESPREHGARMRLRDLPERAETLAERYAAQGYATCAVVSNPLLKSSTGLHQGFERYETGPALGGWHVSSEEVTELALDCLDDWGPSFVFVHYFDPHDFYVDHPDIAFASGADTLTGRERIKELQQRREELTERDIDFLRALYAEEVRHTDRWIGVLLDELDPADTVVITSDHGEDLMDHGWIGHVEHLHEELVRVPLIVRMPGLSPGRDGSTTPLERIADALFGEPSALLQEEDALVEVERKLRGVPDIDLSGVVRGDDKQVRDTANGGAWRYDLAADPLDRQQLEVDPALAAAIDAYRAVQAFEVVDVGEIALREQQLKALGYME